MEGRAHPEPRKKKEIKEKEADIVVGMGGWQIIVKPEIGETTALGPCTGYAIFDPITESGVVAHFSDPFIGDADEMLEAVQEKYAAIDVLKADLAGAAKLVIEKDETNALLNREAAVDGLLRIGIKKENIHTNWTPEGQNTILRLDTKRKGKVTRNTIPDDELAA